MANQPRPDNPGRHMRIDDALWGDLESIAAEDSVAVSAVVRVAARQYVARRRAAAARRKTPA